MKSTREKLSEDAIRTFLDETPGWSREGGDLRKTFSFATYGEGVAFAVAVAFAADKRDHHPDLHVSYAKVEVRWTTHDAGGITRLDVDLAATTDRLA